MSNENAEKNMSWFRIQRSFMDDELWLSEPFTKGQAWVDLIGMANFADSKIFNGAAFFKVHRGSIVTSELTLSKRWKWSRSKVDSFLKALEINESITMKKHNKGTLITLCNYCVYQGDADKKEQQKSNKKASKEQQANIKPTHNKKNKEREEREEGEKAPEKTLFEKYGVTESMLVKNLLKAKKYNQDKYDELLAEWVQKAGTHIVELIKEAEENEQ